MNINRRLKLYATCVACLGGLLFGVDLAFSADLINEMNDMKITIQEQSIISSINMYASAVSSIAVAYFLNALGRKNCLIFILLCYLMAWLLMYFFVYTMLVVYISRILSGFAGGMRIAIVVYISETAHKSRRGIMLSLFGLVVSLGISVTFVIQYFASWHTVALVSLIISVSGFIQIFFLKETKYWHLYRQNVEGARESIKWFNGSMTEAEIQVEIDEILSSDSQERGGGSSIITSLKNQTNLKNVIFGVLLFTFMYGCGRIQLTAQPYNYYVQFQLPVTYSSVILTQGILEIVMSILCSLVIDSVPRRTMLHLCCWSMNACLVVVLLHDILIDFFGLVGQWVLVIALMIFFGLACGFLLSIVMIMAVEIASISTATRGFTQSMLFFWSGFISGVYNQVFPYALVAVSVNYIVLFFFLNLTLLSFTGFFVPETHGKALHHCNTGEVTQTSIK